MKKKIALLLALVMSLSTAAMTACGDAAEETSAATVDTAAVEGAETEADPYAGYDYDGKALRVQSSADDFDSTNCHFLIAGSGETNGEIVNDAVYARNLEVEEGLNIKLEYTPVVWNYGEIIAGLDQLIMAGEDLYDVVVNDMFRLVECATYGWLHSIGNTDILNLEADYWYDDAMEDLVLYPGAMYLMYGDYFTDSLASTHVLYYNKDLIRDNYGDQNYLHDIILEGDFTADVMFEIMETTALDLNGDGAWTEGDDIFGYAVPDPWGPIMPLITGFDTNFISRDADGNAAFDFNNEHSVKVLETTNSLFWHYTSLRDTEDIINNVHSMLANGQVTFAGYLRMSDFAKMRDYEITVGLSVYPKLDENQEKYISSLHDTSEVGAILATTPTSNLEFILTCLEFLGQATAKIVIPAWYEEALKIKYSTGEENAVVLDIIRESIDEPFALAYAGTLSKNALAACFLDPVRANSTDFASAYAGFIHAGEASLAEIVAAYRENMERNS